MARVLSAIVLLPVVIGTVWFFPTIGTLTIAVAAAVLAVLEYATLAAALGARIPRALSVIVVVSVCLATGLGGEPHTDLQLIVGIPATPWIPVVLAGATIAIGTRAVLTGAPGPDMLRDAAAALFPALYIGLPLGTLVAVGADSLTGGPGALILLMAVIVVSDSAQYYTGRALGRRPLAPAISPKKTVEGAIGGLIFGTLAMVIGGRWVFASPIWVLAVVGAAVAVLGMIGDLFESLLKRSANLKDSSRLIPGHGGILDRIDSWLFAAPAYYLFVRVFATLRT